MICIAKELLKKSNCAIWNWIKLNKIEKVLKKNARRFYYKDSRMRNAFYASRKTLYSLIWRQWFFSFFKFLFQNRILNAE